MWAGRSTSFIPWPRGARERHDRCAFALGRVRVRQVTSRCRRPGAANGRGDRLRMSFMLASMKRLAVSSRHRVFPCGVCGVQSSAVTVVRCGLARFCQSSIRARQGRGLTRSPAQEGIRGVGAPSIQRPCDGGQVNIRAHPPIEPAKDQGLTAVKNAPGDCRYVTGLSCDSRIVNSVAIEILCSLAPQLTDAGDGSSPMRGTAVHRPRRLGGTDSAAWLEHAAVAQERIEDTCQATGEGDDGDVLAAAGRDA